MNIRHALPEDLDVLSGIEAESYPTTEGASRDNIQKRIQYYPDHFWILENDTDEIVAFVNGFCTNDPDLTDEMYDHPEMHDPEGVWQMIFSVVTAPEHRGQGYAGMLLKQVKQDARTENRKGIVLTCKERLIPFYSKYGFADEGISASVHGNVVWHQMRCLLEEK
jgi:ribosomal protein S18 acetylase RimI-like enzyme